jgi:hypothetical protein
MAEVSCGTVTAAEVLSEFKPTEAQYNCEAASMPQAIFIFFNSFQS